MRLRHVALIATLLTPGVSVAQTNAASAAPPESETTGLNAFVQVQASSSTLGIVTSLDANVGYRYNDHFGGDIGLPLIYTRSPFSLVSNHDWVTTTLPGEPYLDVYYKNAFAGVKITSVLTGTIPPASSLRVFSTGRPGVDLFNHVESENSFKGIKPFLNVGVSNGTVNRYYMPRPYSVARPYQTLGFMGDGEGGITYKFRRYTVGGSAYVLVPDGPQKVFSRFVAPNSPVFGDGNHFRFFDSGFETVGRSTIARDNGVSGWVEVTRVRGFTLQIGYTRSVHYRLDTATLTVNFDATSLIRTVTGVGVLRQ